MVRSEARTRKSEETRERLLDAAAKVFRDKGYAGALSVELFLPKFTQGDPFEVAREIRQKSEAVMRQAGVL